MMVVSAVEGLQLRWLTDPSVDVVDPLRRLVVLTGGLDLDG